MTVQLRFRDSETSLLRGPYDRFRARKLCARALCKNVARNCACKLYVRMLRLATRVPGTRAQRVSPRKLDTKNTILKIGDSFLRHVLKIGDVDELFSVKLF